MTWKNLSKTIGYIRTFLIDKLGLSVPPLRTTRSRTLKFLTNFTIKLFAQNSWSRLLFRPELHCCLQKFGQLKKMEYYLRPVFKLFQSKFYRWQRNSSRILQEFLSKNQIIRARGRHLQFRSDAFKEFPRIP